MAAAEKFKTPENPAGLGGEVSSTVSQPIPEESEDEGEVKSSLFIRSTNPQTCGVLIKYDHDGQNSSSLKGVMQILLVMMRELSPTYR